MNMSSDNLNNVPATSPADPSRATPSANSLTATQIPTSKVAAPGPLTTHQSLVTLAAIGIAVGAVGGALKAAALHDSFPESLISGAIFGLLFGVFFSRRAASAGAGLIWGLGLAFLAWIVFPNGAGPLQFRHTSAAMFADVRERFPLL